ncbi:MAG: lysophospholipid acyltransferase family protein [Pseudomonadota bacterium]|uniref:lysophospholipid acyltransferase family protein n=1 Tax=Thermithiobacillus tepidarius TaxID=929 RepID=UPI0003FA597B|nr:lysophospholipid acyltransferase family protein [Thermithiobacillus tepidarius]
MITLRTLLFYVGFWLWTLLWGIITLLTAPLPRSVSYRSCAFWGRVAIAWLRLSCGIRYRVEGREHIPATPVVIVANHQSAWETLAFLNVFPRFAYVLKQELFRLPIFGWALKLSWPIGIDRKAGRDAVRQVLREGEKRIQAGVSVLVFPEGTRQPPHELGRFASTGAGLAVKTGVPVLPVAHNAGHCWPRNDWRKYPGTIEVRIGAPLSSKGKTAVVLNDEVHDWIADQLPDMA